MGFSCGLYKVKKFNTLDLKQIHTINSYYDYQENDWAKNNYITWQDCSKNQYTELYSEVSQADIDCYKDEYIYRDYSKSIFKPIEDWCSNGTNFHDWFMEKGQEITDYMVILDQETIIAALNMCSTELQSMSFKQVKVEHAFTEDSNTDIITLLPCNGIEIEDEDGNIKREYTDDWEYTNLYTPTTGYFDESKYDAYTRLLDALITILTTTDFENEIVFYEGGW